MPIPHLATLGRWMFALFCLAQLLAASGNEGGSDAPAATSPLAQFDADLKLLRAAVWTLNTRDPSLGADPRGRTVSDDVRDFMLTPDTQTRLDRLRQRIAGASTPAAAAAALAEAKQVFRAESDRLDTITAYWAQMPTLQHHQALWQHLADQLPEQASKASGERIQALWASLRECMQPPFDKARLERARDQLIAGFNRERQGLAGLVDAAAARIGGAPAGRDRQHPCPEPALKTSGKPKPEISKAVTTEQLYPQSARRDEVVGKTTLRLHVAESGCMVRADVYRSSGAPELDNAALEGAELLEFLPAERDGHAVAAVLPLEFAFRLKE